MATARAERRLAAILAADVVGYARLVQHDEAVAAGRPMSPLDVRLPSRCSRPRHRVGDRNLLPLSFRRPIITHRNWLRCF
ncbi:MAG: hypothetical protein E5W98_00440 [Mesorhizobium sp.]|nr:MAG: hypothetical protein E5W98_00440 [Mesorhizobium sp.]